MNNQQQPATEQHNVLDEEKEIKGLDKILFRGGETNFRLPSGNTITIREQNADDDDIMSSTDYENWGDNLLVFLASIIVMDKNLNRKPSKEDIAAWPIKDKYYAIFKSRIFSVGNKIKWEHTCSDDKCKHTETWNEDLEPFDGKFWEEGYKTLTPYSITAYPMGKTKVFEKTLTSGKRIRFGVMTTKEELELLELGDKATKNSPLLVRNLEVYFEGDFKSVPKMNMFSKAEAIEMHQFLDQVDSKFTPMTFITCPKCKLKEGFAVMMIPTFFYPVEM